MSIAIITSQFYKKISDRLLTGAQKALREAKFKDKEMKVFEVPGAFEIPHMAQTLIDTKKYDGIIALGCLIKGETDHYEAVCNAVSYGIQKVSIENRIPITFGVLMCQNEMQAIERSQKNPQWNKGYECAQGLMKLLKSRKSLL